jgi:hypothetical protein
MRIPLLRFLLAVAVFLAWLGWLSYLAITASRPVVVSRPQVLVSTYDVIAEVGDPDKPVVIKEVLFSADKDTPAVGDTIPVRNLGACHPPTSDGSVLDWAGPGQYLLLLHKVGKEYEVVPPPDLTGLASGSPRLYPATEEVLRQYHESKPKE